MLQHEKAIEEFRETIRLYPTATASQVNLANTLVSVNRFAEAKEIFARQQRMDSPYPHSLLYAMAFFDGDTTAMQRQIDWAKGQPGEYVADDWQASVAAIAGQWRQAQDFARRSIDLATRGNNEVVAAQYAAEQSLRAAVVQSPGFSLQPPKGGTLNESCALNVTQSLALERNQVTLARVSLSLALCGEASQATALIDELERNPGSRITRIWQPTIKAALELQRGNAAQAVEWLEAAKRYEPAAEFWPQYLRGQAYLKLSKAAEAAAEFQRILDHRGQSPLSALYPLAHLGLARASALAGDTAKARKAYQDFFTLWKNADPDLPPLIEAKKGYERLR